MINWNSTRNEALLFLRIAERAAAEAKRVGIPYTVQDASMDIAATHLNGCPMRLGELLMADEFNFQHDVFGIRRHIDRSTGKIDERFCPRFAQREVK